MASKKPSELQACTSPNTANDHLILGLANASSNTETILIDTLFGNIANVDANSITTNTLYVEDNTTPSNSTANVTQGRVWYDSDYLYIAVSNNVIKRIALTSF